jgi:hypothetical protein
VQPVLQCARHRCRAGGLRSSGDQRRYAGVAASDPQIAIDGKAAIGETRIGVNGRLVSPQGLRSLDLTLDLSGRDLAQL